MIVAGTGHRPDKLGGYSFETQQRLFRFSLRCLRKLEPELVISGMALGWDQALALAAVWLNVPFDAYVPFQGQESRWPKESQQAHALLLRKARNVVYCSEPGYDPRKMQVRNEMMVNRANTLLALWNGTPGGTANCVRYAERQYHARGTPAIYNVWAAWERYGLRAS